MKFPTLRFALAWWVLSLAPVHAQHDDHEHFHGSPDQAPALRREAWAPEVLKLAASIPVQDGGRVKPLDTFASFAMLKMNGKRRVETPQGEVLKPTAWILDCLLFPAQASHYPHFLVSTWEVLDSIQVDRTGKEKRDHYSYAELSRGRDKLFQLAGQYSKIEEKNRSPVENQIVHLGHNILEFEALIDYLEFARRPLTVNSSQGLKEVFGDASTESLSVVLSRMPDLYEMAKSLQADGEAAPEEERTALFELLQRVQFTAQRAKMIRMLPPADAEEPEWRTPFEVAEQAYMTGEAPSREQLAMLAGLEQMVGLSASPPDFQKALESFHQKVRETSEARDEYSKIELEVLFYKGDFIYRSLAMFGGAFLFVALGWLMPRVKLLGWAALGFNLVAWGTLVAGITLRCIIRSRPPISTLYETILFIAAVGVLTALIAEWINRKKVGLALASILGMVLLFMANKYEVKEGVDTMPSLVAVLDTNFWLATHVTIIVTGYAAGLLAAVIAHVYLLGKLFGFRKGNKKFYKDVSRMVYGAICFGLLFSVVGTILGGIWANDSWGRFWGWDPKENGALLICIWQLIMLHGRLGGYLKDHGMSVAAVFGGMVVAFSWWHVNLLETGLHSYGFTAGLKRSLFTFYGIECGVMLLGWIAWARQSLRIQVVK